MAEELSKEIRSDFYNLFNRVNKDKPVKKDLTDLRSMLSKNPNLWDVVGGLAEQNIFRLLAETNMTEGIREVFRANLNSIQSNLGYNSSPMLEKMLIESVLLVWLRLNIYEYQMSVLDNQGMTLGKASFWEKRLSASMNRYLRVCRTLAHVRRLSRNIPALQVNINTESGQQLNVLGDLNKLPENHA